MASSSSSLSLAPVSTTRRFVRLAEPSSRTVEQISGGNLTITITLPIEIVNQYASMIPNSGPDTLVVNYTDGLNQSNQFIRNVTLWGSDSGWVFLSLDQGTQFLIGGVDGKFFDTNAITLNNRNIAATAAGLLPASNAARYGSPVLLPNQVRPKVWIRDGSSMSAG